MDIEVTRLVELYNELTSCESLEELTEWRDRVRPEVKKMRTANQAWLLANVEQHEHRIKTPIPDYNKPLKGVKDES